MAVANLGIASDRADFGIDKPASQLGDGIGLKLGIGIKRDDDLALGQLESLIERAGLAAVLQREELHAGIAAEGAGDNGAGLVLRSIVDDNNFKANIAAL